MSAPHYKKEHLPKAINIPLKRVRQDSGKQLRKDEAVIVYSRDHECDLSARAAWHLESMGFHEVYRYTAGMADWVAAGYPTEGSHARKTSLLHRGQTQVPVCGLRDRLRDVKNRYAPSEQDICAVINDRNILLGAIHGEAWNGEPLAVVADLMDTDPLTFRPSQDPAEALKLMRKDGIENALITTSDGELLGVFKSSRKKVQRPQTAA